MIVKYFKEIKRLKSIYFMAYNFRNKGSITDVRLGYTMEL